MRPEAHSFDTQDGKRLTFLFDFAGMVAAEKAADAPFADVVSGAVAGRIGYLAALIEGGLSGHHRSVTGAAAFELMKSEGAALADAMWAALKAAMPEPTGGAADPPKPGSRGTGSRSSARGSRKASPRKASGGSRRAASR